MTVNELKKECKKINLWYGPDVSGKIELIALLQEREIRSLKKRIEELEKEKTAAKKTLYENMTVKQLKEEIKKRGARMFCAISSATKSDLVQALQRNDSGETTMDRIRRAYH